MAKKSFRCRLITPEAQVLDGPTTNAILPAWDGSMGVLPGRAPMVVKLGIGELRLDFPGEERTGGGMAEGGTRSFLVEGGFAHMVGETLTILASRATPAERLTESDAQAELAEAEARRMEGAKTEADRDRIRADRDKAREKLRMARVFKARGGAI